jgi:hypothetical protein
MQNDELAVRIFTQCANNEEHQFGSHPEDYTLHFLGDFDAETGTLEEPGLDTKVISALQVQKPEAEKLRNLIKKIEAEINNQIQLDHKGN